MGMNKEKMMEEVHGLNADYGLYIGQLIMEGVRDEQIVPTEYLEAYMEMHTTPPYEVCCGFLLQFMEYDKVSEWLNQFPWDEEEEEDPVQEIINRIKSCDRYVEILEMVIEIRTDFLKIDWDWYGLQDLADDGTVDEKMYYRMWLDARAILDWEIPLEHHVEVFMGLEEAPQV